MRYRWSAMVLVGIGLAPWTLVHAQDADVAPSRPALRFLKPAVATTSQARSEFTIEPLPAPEGSAIAPEMSLAELEGIALSRNPSLAQAAANLRAARGAWLQVGLYPNPSFGYVASEVGNEGRAGQQGLFVGQEVVTAGKLKLNRQAAAQQVRQAEAILSIQQWRVLNDVRAGYYDALIAQRALRLSTNLVEIGNSSAKAAEDLFKALEVSRVDVLQARIEADTARVVLRRAENRHAAAWRSLAAVLGTPDLTPTPLADDLDAEHPRLVWHEALGQVLSQSPELAAAQAEVQRAAWAVRRAQVEPLPNLEMQAGAQYDNASQYQLANVQIGVPLPIFNRNQGNIRRAQAEWTSAQADVSRIELDLHNRLAAAFERYTNARQQTEIYSRDILPNAKEALELLTVGYRQGEFTYLSLLTAQRTYLQTNLTYLEALRELRLSIVAIEGLLLSGSLQNAPPAALR